MGKDALSDSDWDYLSEVLGALRNFYLTTKDGQSHAAAGHHGSVWEWLPAIEWLLKKCGEGREAAAESHGRTSWLAIAYQNAYQKLQEYWNLTDDSHVIYAAATLLSPLSKQAYFDANWNDREKTMWKEKMLKAVRQYWESSYQNTAIDSNDHDVDMIEPSPLSEQLGLRQEQSDDPWQSYITSDTLKPKRRSDINIIEWWATIGRPALRQFAFDVLSIPAMSTEVERIFSSAKLAPPPHRRRTKADTLEVKELLRYWWCQSRDKTGYETEEEFLEAVGADLDVDDSDGELELDDDDVLDGIPE